MKRRKGMLTLVTRNGKGSLDSKLFSPHPTRTLEVPRILLKRKNSSNFMTS